MRDLSSEELLEKFTSEIVRLSEEGVTISLQFSPGDAMALMGAIQLACRHSGYTGPSSQIVRRIADRIQSKFMELSAWHTLEVIRRGWNPNYDEPGGKL